MPTVSGIGCKSFTFFACCVVMSIVSVFLWKLQPLLVNKSIRQHEATQPTLTYDYTSQLRAVLVPSKRNISLVVNSCARLDLLNKTISSFLKYYPHSKYPLHEKILIDDCRNKKVAHYLIEKYMPDFELIFTARNEFEKSWRNNRMPRITKAMDRSQKQITTDWIYHIEDDYEWTSDGFMDDAFNIFEYSLLNPSNDMYSIVLCRIMPPQAWQLGFVKNSSLQTYKNTSWYTMTYAAGWGGFTFNSGLYPKFIYDHYGPFSKLADERLISKQFAKDKLHVALTTPPTCNSPGQHLRVKGNKN